MLARHLRFKNSVKDVKIFPPYFFINVFLHQLDFQQFQFSCDYLFELKNFVVVFKIYISHFARTSLMIKIPQLCISLHTRLFKRKKRKKNVSLASLEAVGYQNRQKIRTLLYNTIWKN